MTVKELKADIKAGKFSQVYLLYGEEAFLRTHYVKQLCAPFMGGAFDEFNVFIFEDKTYSTTDVENAIEALPMMAEHKLLVFHDSLIFKPDGRTGAKAEIRAYWEKRLKELPDYCHIIFNESSVDKRSTLYKYLTKQYCVCEFGYLSEREMVDWTVKLFRTYGKTLSAFDAQYLIGLCDEGMHNIKREAEKLAAYTDGQTEVTRADIDAVVVPSVKSKAFDMVDAIFAKNSDKALRLLNDLFILREPELKILGAINYQLDKLLSVKLLTDSGADKSELIAKLKLPPFLAGKYLSAVKGYPLSAIQAMTDACSRADLAMKSNSIDNRILLELLIAENCA